jgi:uncharacterized membrane protein
MSTQDQLDVLIALYLIPDLARKDFDVLATRVRDKTVLADGIVLVSKNASGEVKVEETGDHLGRKGLRLGAGVGLAIGLFSPPLLAAAAAGAAFGGAAAAFARHRVVAGIAGKMDEALPPGSAGIIAVYDHGHADTVANALSNAIRTSSVQIDKVSAGELKAGLEKASAGLAG